MEEFFSGHPPEHERPDIQLCLFPHLKEFLAIDLREDPPQIWQLSATEVLDHHFYQAVEQEFSSALREGGDFPFAHLMNLPLRLEELVRGVAMSFILERMGIDPDDEEQLPSVVVFVISGGALAMHSERLIASLKDMLPSHHDQTALAEWEQTLTRLVEEENAALQRLSHNELAEALKSDSPDYFTLWENRN